MFLGEEQNTSTMYRGFAGELLILQYQFDIRYF